MTHRSGVEPGNREDEGVDEREDQEEDPLCPNGKMAAAGGCAAEPATLPSSSVEDRSGSVAKTQSSDTDHTANKAKAEFNSAPAPSKVRVNLTPKTDETSCQNEKKQAAVGNTRGRVVDHDDDEDEGELLAIEDQEEEEQVAAKPNVHVLKSIKSDVPLDRQMANATMEVCMCG